MRLMLRASLLLTSIARGLSALAATYGGTFSIDNLLMAIGDGD